MEDFFCNKAKILLIKAREICGFETKSPTYTVQWWKAYRHKNREGTVNGLIEEHMAQFSSLTPEEREKYANYVWRR